MPTTDPELDVRDEPPARRHQLIFETYGKLAGGEGFVWRVRIGRPAAAA